MNWNYMQPVTIKFGNGRIKELGEEIQKLGGHKGILITSPSFEKRGMVKRILEESKGLLQVAYSEVSPNPDIKECEACAKLVEASKHPNLLNNPVEITQQQLENLYQKLR